MSESEIEPGGIRDEDLPEDVRPGEDNPLAEPLDDDVDPDELDVHGGKGTDQDSGEHEASGSDGADGESRAEDDDD
jgi:hypothetical protein